MAEMEWIDQAFAAVAAASSEHPPASRPPKMDFSKIRIDGAEVDTLDYLGSETFLNHLVSQRRSDHRIHRLTVDSFMSKAQITDTAVEADGLVDTYDLETQPKPWQSIGAEKLWRLAKSPFRGGLLGDTVGLGKSLTALLVAIRIRRAQPRSGFILVVCRKACLRQWYDEIQQHFKTVSWTGNVSELAKGLTANALIKPGTPAFSDDPK
jgi:superfamily II DNA or RNA helicase